jgi:hypothetical protein
MKRAAAIGALLAVAGFAADAEASTAWHHPQRVARAYSVAAMALDSRGTFYAAVLREPDSVTALWSLRRGASRARVERIRFPPRTKLPPGVRPDVPRWAANARGDRLVAYSYPTRAGLRIGVMTGARGRRLSTARKLPASDGKLVGVQVAADGRALVLWQLLDGGYGYATSRIGSGHWVVGRMPAAAANVWVAFQRAGRLLWTWVMLQARERREGTEFDERMHARSVQDHVRRVPNGRRILANHFRPLHEATSIQPAAIATGPGGHQTALWPARNGVRIAGRSGGAFRRSRYVRMPLGRPSVVRATANEHGDAVFLCETGADLFVFVQRNSAKVRGPFRVTPRDADHKPGGTGARVAIDAFGQAVVVWQGHESPNGGGGYVWATTVGARAVPSKPQVVARGANGLPGVVVNDHGVAAIAWSRYGHSPLPEFLTIARGRIG